MANSNSYRPASRVTLNIEDDCQSAHRSSGSTSSNENCNDERSKNNQNTQTMPKVAEAQVPQLEFKPEAKNETKSHMRKYQADMTIDPPEWKPPLASSLVASPSSWRSITIEPATLLAVIALFIEFPTVQDLIYTKICLQNIADSSLHDVTRRNLEVEVPIASDAIIRTTDSSLSICDRVNRTGLETQVRLKIEREYQIFWLMYQLIICIMCAFSAPYWGGISDRIGRIIPLNAPIVMSTLSNATLLAAGILISTNRGSLFSVEWLFLGAVLIGLSGGQAVVIVNSFSFISDNTTVESRSKRIVILETVQNVGHSVGFMIAKYITKIGLDVSREHSNRPVWINRHFVAFSTCCLINLLCVLYSIFWLRHHRFHRFLNNFEREHYEASIGAGSTSNWNSMMVRRPNAPPDGQLRRMDLSVPNFESSFALVEPEGKCLSAFWTLTYYKQTYRTLTKTRDSRLIISLLLLCGFISSTCLALLLSLLYIYLRAEPFNMITSDYSSWNMWTSIAQGVALVSLSIGMKLVKSWNIPDPLVSALGFLSKSLGLLVIGLAQSTDHIAWASLALVLSEFSMPPIRSLLSKLVAKDELAKIYSCLSALLSICFVFTNIVFYLAYNSFEQQHFYRLSFVAVSMLQFAAFGIMLYIYSYLRQRTMII